jgi:uncharacterized protein YcfL
MSLPSLKQFLALCAIVALAGCASEPSVPSADKSSPEAVGQPVVLLDEDMDHYVAVDGVTSTRNENGYLVVQADIRSQAERDFSIQAQTLFYDKNGMILNGTAGNESPWTVIPLTANSTFPFKVQSLSTAAQKFSIRLRYLVRKPS